MRLVAELRDAPWLHLTTRVDNVAAARRATADWVRILRGQLDAARGIPE